MPRVKWHFAILGLAGAGGFALDAYMAGRVHWIPWGIAVTILLTVASYSLALRGAGKQGWDPQALFAGARLVYMSIVLFSAGMVLSRSSGDFLTISRTHEIPPASWVTEGGIVVMLVGNGLWWLSWPRSAPYHGQYRWVGWWQIGAGAFTVLSSVVFQVIR